MNHQDFHRNFRVSYFGLVLNDDQIQNLLSQGFTDAKYDLTPGQLIPVTSPSVDGRRFLGRGIFKLKDSDNHTGIKFFSKWAVDIDEDPTYIRPGVPAVGMLQGLYTAWYVTRRAVRDTPRGHCPSHNQANLINRQILRATGLENGDEYLATYRVYNPVRYPWAEACRLVNDGELLGAVVSRFIAIGIDGVSRFSQIYYKNQGPVGYVEGTTPYLYKASATFPLREYIRKLSGEFPEVK